MKTFGRVPARRVERLVESRPILLAISDLQAAELRELGKRLASKKRYWATSDDDDSSGSQPESTVIRCRRVSDDIHEVTVVDAVGLVAVDGLQLEVHPKIPLNHLYYLMSAGNSIPRLDVADVSAQANKTLWELVALWFVQALDRVLARGLLSDYRSNADLLEAARGRVLVLETAAAYYSGRIGVASDYDEFDEDMPLNRLLLAAAQAIAETPGLNEDLRKRAFLRASRMDTVGPLLPGDLYIQVDRRSAYYADAIALARHILDATGRSIAFGLEKARVFLIRTPEMVEAGIRSTLKANLEGVVRIEKRGMRLPNSSLTMNPDLVFGNVAVGDVKYRLLTNQWNRSDLYQIVAFATAYRVCGAALVAFGSPHQELPGDLALGNVLARAFCWKIGKDISPEESAYDLARAVKKWLSDIAVEIATVV